MYEIQESNLFRLLRNSHAHTLTKGQTVQFSGDRMFVNLVDSGYIKRFLVTNDGEESIQVIYGPHDIFPLTPVFVTALQLEIYRGDEILYYEALTNTRVYSVEKTVFLEALQADESLYKDLFYVAGTRLESNIQRLENISLRAADRKVIDMLVYFATRFSTKTDQGTLLQIPLTHQTIASILNIARETVSHQIAHLHEKGLIETQPLHMILIPDVNVLKTAR